MNNRVWNTWYRVWNSWYRVWNTWYRVWNTWYRVWGTWYRVWNTWYRVWNTWYRVWNTWYRVWNTWYRVWNTWKVECFLNGQDETWIDLGIMCLILCLIQGLAWRICECLVSELFCALIRILSSCLVVIYLLSALLCNTLSLFHAYMHL